MKRLSMQEFSERLQAIDRARKIFIGSGLTKSISIAFEIYQEVLAQSEYETFLNTMVHGRRNPTVMDNYERPKCPDCNSDMMFRAVQENNEGIKTQLVCSKKDCDTVLDSENDLKWWMGNLLKK